MNASVLQSQRKEIDDIDERILALLARRFEVTSEVGRLKAMHRLPSVDAERELQQMKRYEALAAQHGLEHGLVAQLFRCVIDEVVRNHEAFGRMDPAIQAGKGMVR